MGLGWFDIDPGQKEMIYIGDASFMGGYDYPAEQAGVISIPVRGPEDTKRVIEAVLACLGDVPQAELQVGIPELA